LDWLGFWGEGDKGREEYRAFVGAAFGRAVENPWADLRGGLVLGTEALWEKVQGMVKGKAGQQEKRWVQGENAEELSRRLRQILDAEVDARVKIWARARLGGERMADMAKELGYADGTAVTQIVKRMEANALVNEALRQKLDGLKRTVSFVRS
jgi:hypothetical protein